MKIIIEYQDQFGKWNRFQEKHNAADAYQVAKIVLNQQRNATAWLMAMGT